MELESISLSTTADSLQQLLSRVREDKAVLLAHHYVDMRKSINGLAGILQGEYGIDSFNGDSFLFCNRQKDKVKIIQWDSEGFILTYKRRTKAKTVLDDYFDWAKQHKPVVLTKSLLGIALTYAVNQEKYLRNYLRDGRLEISNNQAERAVKPFVIGLRNWLFANTSAGANASAVIYSIVETAKENDLIPFAYLEYLLEEIPNLDRTGKIIADMLPWSDSLPQKCRSKYKPK